MLKRSTPRPLTAHDYRELPDGPPYFQLIEGEVQMSPSPKWFHQKVLTNVLRIIFRYLDENPIGEVCCAPLDTFLTDLNVYQPDVLFVSNDRKSILQEDGVQGAPTLVVEILSERTAKYDRGPKREVYSRTGVEELWIVDPELKQVQVFRFEESTDKPFATYSVKQKFTTPVFPGLTVPVADIFKR